jgi:hypothetical protein
LEVPDWGEAIIAKQGNPNVRAIVYYGDAGFFKGLEIIKTM